MFSNKSKLFLIIISNGYICADRKPPGVGRGRGRGVEDGGARGRGRGTSMGKMGGNRGKLHNQSCQKTLILLNTPKYVSATMYFKLKFNML